MKAREDFLKREMSRVSELIARGIATTQAYERASMDLRQVQGLISVQIEKINDYTIIAPMDGVVLRRDGEIGEIAEVGQILFRVGVPKPLQVVAEVNEEDIPRVAIGQTVLFRTDAFPERRLEGKVREITPMGDVVAKTYRIKMALPDDTPLKPGMSVEANIVTREKPNALLIPADAVQGNAVFVLDGAHVRKREVKIGIRGTRDGRSALRPRRRRAGRLAGGDRAQGRRPRPRHRDAGHESHPRHRLDPCARARAADRLRRRRRRHRRRLLDHDGLADAGLAGRFHPAAGQHAAAHHRLRRAAHAAAAAGGGAVRRRRDPRPDAGGAPARHQESARHHGRAGSLAARRRWRPRSKVQAIIRYANHDVATSVIGIDPRRESKVSDLPKQMRGATLAALYRATNAIVLGDRLAEKIGARIGANITLQTSQGARISAQVVGFFHTGVRQIDEGTAYVLTKTGQILAAADRPDQRIARARSPIRWQSREIAARIESDTGYKSVSWQEAQRGPAHRPSSSATSSCTRWSAPSCWWRASAPTTSSPPSPTRRRATSPS